MADWRRDWGCSGRRDRSAEGVLGPGDSRTPLSVTTPKLMIFGRYETVIDVSDIEGPTDKSAETPGRKKRKKRRGAGSQTQLDNGKEAKDDGNHTLPRSGPEESMYLLGCKPRVVYIELPTPLEEDSSVFGYIPDSLPPGTELTMTEEEQMTTVSRDRSPERHHAKLHRKSDPQTDDTKNKMKIWCFSTGQEATGKRTERQKNTRKLSKGQEAATHQPMIALGGRVQEVLENHFNRISEVQSRLELIRKEIPSEEQDSKETDLLEVDSKKETDLLELDSNETDLLEVDSKETDLLEVDLKKGTDLLEVDSKKGTDLLEVDSKKGTDLLEVDSKKGTDLLEVDSKKETDLLEVDSKKGTDLLEVDSNETDLLEVDSKETDLLEVDSKNGTDLLEVDPLEEEEASGRLNREKRALEDKEEELNQQTLEFLLHLKSTYDGLAKVSHSVTRSRRRMNYVMSLECNRLSAALPIYARRSDVVDTVKKNQVTVLVGDTGCGKSTQIPQYLCEAGLADGGVIVCTQPRKVAAISLAYQVAKEMDVTVGEAVGYIVGRNRRMTGRTQVSYVTDNFLLTECLRDKELSPFSCIIVDEAHERSIYTDLLLGMIKKCLQKRPNLRVVITSATIEPEVFVKYFRGCPVLHVSGRQFPVEIEWKRAKKGDDSFINYEGRAVKKAIQIHKSTDKGDILVFLATPLEVERCCVKFDLSAEENPKTYITIPLHGKLQKHEQQRVFDPTPRGERKIIFSTNSGETSVTIPTVKFVIDTGVAKEMDFDDICKMNVLSLNVISQSRATQRLGRAGRLCPGKCFRLYTKEDYKDMNAASLPEILKSDIGLALLNLMDLEIDPLRFDYVTSPSKEALEEAYASLVSIGAVAEKRITYLGRRIAKLPLEPRYGALVYEGYRKGVGSEAIVIAAVGAWTNVFFKPKNNVARQQQVRFHHHLGDQLTILNVFRAWFEIQEESKSDWCSKHLINAKAMTSIYETAKDIMHAMYHEWKVSIRLSFRESAAADALLASILCKAFSRNLSYSLGHPETSYCIALKEMDVDFMEFSVTRTFDPLPEWIVFDQISSTAKADYVKNATPVSEELLVEGIREGWLSPVINEIRKTRMSVVCEVYVGQQLVQEFCAPESEHLKRFLSLLESKSPESEARVVGNKNKGVLRVLAREWSRPHLSGSLRKALSPLKVKHQREKSLQRVGSRRESVRAVIGAGGSTTNILMPDECRVVVIHCPENSEAGAMSEEDVLEAFGHYGEIEDCRRFIQTEKSTIWGYVVYKNIQSALKAIKKTEDGSEGIAEPNGRSCFMKKIQWDRVPIVDSGYVTFSHKKYADKAKSYNFMMCSSFRSARLADHEQENAVRILSLGQLVPEETFREELARALNISPVVDILEVRMPRENKKESEKAKKSLMRKLLGKMGQLKEPDLFHLYFRTPQERDASLTAFCIHRNPGDASVAWKEFNKHLLLKEQVSEEAIYDSSICILKVIFRKHESELRRQMKKLENKGMIVALKHRKNDVMVYLGAEHPNVLAEANEAIGYIIAGEVIDCQGDPRSELLFSLEGKTILVSVMCETETLVVTDDRLMTITIHGSDEDRESAREMITKEIREYSLETFEIDLKGPGKPRGVMNFLLEEFGSRLAGFKIEADLDSVKVDHRNHRLRVTGPSGSVVTAGNMIEKFGKMLIDGKIQDDSNAIDPECVVCLYPTKTKDIYRLECGHGYCGACLKMHVDFAITNREFPLVCIVRTCGTMFVWRDIEALADDDCFELPDLVTASVSSFMSQHKEEFRYCITPLCPSVYRVTETGTPFTCPQCRTRICTTCHTYHHSGLTCVQYNTIVEGT